MNMLFEAPWAARTAWSLLHFLWQGAILWLLAWASLSLVRRQGARTRYALAFGFLVLCLAAPIITYAALAPIPTPQQVQAPFQGVPSSAPLPSMPVAEPSFVLPAAAWVQPRLPWILGLWLAGVALLSLRAAGSWLWLQGLRKTGTWAGNSEAQAQFQVLAQRLGVRRAVAFLESVRVASPFSMGLFKPVVLVPLGFFTHLDSLAAEAVLAHELAHIRRLDALVNGVQCLIETLLFFHPAVWWISRQVRTERECCCDDEAVLACGDALLYVETLSRLDALRGRPLSLAQGARGGNLMERITRLLALDPSPLRLSLPSLTLLGSLALGTTLVLAQTPQAPQPPLPPAPVEVPVSLRTLPRPPKPPLPPAPPVEPRVSLVKPSLFEAFEYLASVRKLNLLVDPDVTDVKAPIKLQDCLWSQATEGLLRTHQLGMELHGNVMRIAKDWRLRTERMPSIQPPTAPTAPTAPAPSSPPVSRVEGVAGTPSGVYAEAPRRTLSFRFFLGKEGEGKLYITVRHCTRGEILEALKRIEHLGKTLRAGDTPASGEWTLPAVKDGQGGELLTFSLDGVTIQSVRELYK